MSGIESSGKTQLDYIAERDAWLLSEAQHASALDARDEVDDPIRLHGGYVLNCFITSE